VSGYHVGSVLLAHDSTDGVSATRSRVAGLQETARTGGVRLWVAADQEGGFVQHLKGPGFSAIPTALVQGGWSPARLRDQARVWGLQLRDAGVNLDLAPVADTVSTALGGGNLPIGYYDREYGHLPSVVSSHALAVRDGMRDAHVQTAAKHFPGLGRVHGNTDTTYGVTDDTTTRYGDDTLQPFRDLVDDHVPLVMVSSAVYTRIDPTHVGPMSAIVMRGMLRHDLSFDGTVISDDLSAAALSDVPASLRALRFLQAGGDVALVGDSTEAASMIETVLSYARTEDGRRLVDGAALQVLRTKAREGLLPC
jgi:beta-N-acetylhexosaminidase